MRCCHSPCLSTDGQPIFLYNALSLQEQQSTPTPAGQDDQTKGL